MPQEKIEPIRLIATENVSDDTPLTIAKPGEFSLDKFKSKRSPDLPGVKTLLPPLPHHNMKEAEDYMRLHPNEAEYWSPELCFVNVPTIGQRETLHPIDEELALRYLPKGRIKRFCLVLAALPDNRFFLCHLPTQNLDNAYNATSIRASGIAKKFWVQVTSLKLDGVEDYKIDYAENQDTFPEPNWPEQKLEELILKTFEGRTIDHNNHPGLLRPRGAKQSLA